MAGFLRYSGGKPPLPSWSRCMTRPRSGLRVALAAMGAWASAGRLMCRGAARMAGTEAVEAMWCSSVMPRSGISELW